MTKFPALMLSLVSTLGLQACATTTGGGGQPASRPVDQSLVAALDPGLIGSLQLQELGDGDKKLALEAEYRALEYSSSGSPVNWQNSWSGNKGVVVAAQPYRVGAQDCRPYSHTVNVSGKAATARGTACRNTDGSWTPLL